VAKGFDNSESNLVTVMYYPVIVFFHSEVYKDVTRESITIGQARDIT